jgi:hypothetical protein
MSRTLESAKEICAVALKLGAHTWDDPNNVTDADVLQRADELVDASLKASANKSTNDAVVEILFAAQVEPLSEPTREAYTQRFGAPPQTNGNAPEPEAQPAAASAFGQLTSPPSAPSEAQGEPGIEQASPSPVGSPEPASEAAPAAGETLHEKVNAIFGVEYDDLKATQIKAAIADSAASGDLTPEEWEVVKRYESETEQRKTILSFEPEFKAPEPEPQTVTITPSPDGSSTTVDWGSPGVPAHVSTGDDTPLEYVYSGEAQTRAQQEGLPIPAHVALDQAPIVPVNITDISDKDLSALGATFHGLFARAQWLISQEEGRAAAAEHMERETEHDAYVQAYALHKEEIPAEKRTQPTALEAARKQAEKDAETNEKVRTWRSRHVRHGIEVRELKALSNGWDRAVWRIDKELDRRNRANVIGRATR